MSRFRRLAALVLVLVLASSVAMAAPRPKADSSRGKPAAAALADTLVTRLWDWLTAALTKVGCGIDPNGCPNGSQIAPAEEQLEEGCGSDPNGRPCAGGS
jgi:hypothetical protein